MSNLYNDLKRKLEDTDDTGEPLHVEDYVHNTHKMAGHVPYDAIVPLFGDEWSVDDVGDLLDNHDIRYDRVTGVADNNTRHDGDQAAFISLRHR